jgi:carbamate kinase
MRGVEAVVDKDRSAALLARLLAADALLLLTDVPAVCSGWGTADVRAIRWAAPAALERLPLAAGSMGPKVGAACGFVRDTGGFAAIGGLGDASAIVRGEAGTCVSLAAEDLEDEPLGRTARRPSRPTSA